MRRYLSLIKKLLAAFSILVLVLECVNLKSEPRSFESSSACSPTHASYADIEMHLSTTSFIKGVQCNPKKPTILKRGLKVLRHEISPLLAINEMQIRPRHAGTIKMSHYCLKKFTDSPRKLSDASFGASRGGFVTVLMN